ncbi:hypothetical protein SLEP1_g15032 [Rubroshorea leprosula]|uniref:Uncharacterized protein n=1 Tax=Rubroshorea leprosula TaxID=152421 RepID=A0AAV5IL24_9ROSI|nr:hypothetical protein SLEP1_g15032 [Rubroshorea leprosula]
MTSGGWVNPLLCKRFQAILANVVCFLATLASCHKVKLSIAANLYILDTWKLLETLEIHLESFLRLLCTCS